MKIKKKAPIKKPKLSFFAKRPFRHREDGHMMRVSSLIRAWQVAEATGGKLNPEKGYKKDVCIYVKPHISAGHDFNFEGKSNYLDVIDGWALLPTLVKHPEVTAIACSERDYITIAEQVNNKVVLIPQHHCNYERVKRPDREVKTIGCIGTSKAFPFLPGELKESLKERGMDLIEFSTFRSRQDIVEFYKKVDIQIVWRPYRKKLANPLKIVNAASFGIPTVALDEPYFKEMGSAYIAVRSLPEFLSYVDWLRKNPALYRAYSELCLLKAERYHIDNIAKLYRELA